MGSYLVRGAHLLTMDGDNVLETGDVLIEGVAHRRRRAAHRRARRRGDRRPRPHRHARLRRHPPPHVGGDAARRRLLRRPPRLLRQGRLHLRRGLHAGRHVPQRPLRAGRVRRRRHHVHARLGAQHPDARPRPGGAPGDAESGLRGRFSYGPSSDPSAGSSFAQGSETLDFEDILKLREEQFAGDGPHPPRHRLPRPRVLPGAHLEAGVRLGPRAGPADHGALHDDAARPGEGPRRHDLQRGGRARPGPAARALPAGGRGRDRLDGARPARRSPSRSSRRSAAAWACRRPWR